MKRLIALLIAVFATTSSVASEDSSVEVNQRLLLPGRDLTAETTTEAINTMRVVEDRGIVAKSNGRLSSSPLTIHMVSRQAVRYITGSENPDGSFSAEIRFLGKTTSIRSLDGQEQVLPDKSSLKGLVVMAKIDRNGALHKGSVSLSGLDASEMESFRPTMESVMAQAASIEAIQLSMERGAYQEVAMKVPLPGIAPIDIAMRINSRLLRVENGVATVQQTYSMDFGTPAGPMKMTADGSGGGTLLYEVATKTIISNQSNSFMNFVLDSAEGVLAMNLSSKELQSIRPTTVPSQ